MNQFDCKKRRGSSVSQKEVVPSHVNTVADVTKLAVFSRVLVVGLQFLANNLIPDHHPDVFNPPVSANVSVGDLLVSRLFGGFRRWDSIYFLFIAENGYIYENCLAFFPMYPLSVRMFSSVVDLLSFGTLSAYSVVLVAGVLLNVLFFVKAAESLHAWTLAVAGGRYKQYAFMAAVAFCFNPASVFFTACYSESLFAFLTFSGLKNLELARYGGNVASNGLRCSRMHTACALFALSGATRSNGILNLAYIGYVLLLNVYEKYNRVTFLLRKVLECGTYLLLGVTPFCVFQAYSYFLYCKSVPESMPVALEIYARSRGYVHLHEEYRESSWCSDTLPIPYSFIQRSHWDVGFLRYYELKQIPNFILALPILSLSSWSVCRLGVDEETGSLLPYLLHLTALVIVCLFFVHVQIATRMICSASPLLYLCTGILFGNSLRPGSMRRLEDIIPRTVTVFQKIVLMYFCAYFMLGIVLHSNFFPWT